MHTLVTPPGDDAMRLRLRAPASCRTDAPVVMVDARWGWIWMRHCDTISWPGSAPLGHPAAPLTREVLEAFPVDWPALQRSWA